MPQSPHQKLVLPRQTRASSELPGQLRLRAADQVVVEKQVVEHGELVVRRRLALAYVLVQASQATVAFGRVCPACATPTLAALNDITDYQVRTFTYA